MRMAIFIYLIILISFCQHVIAQDFFVNPSSGSDGNIGTMDKPFKTLTKAVQTANELTGKGSISIKLFPGRYILYDKVSINPVRILGDTEKFTIEALIMPDDSNWTPEKMPVIQSISDNNSITQMSHAVGLLENEAKMMYEIPKNHLYINS